MLKLSFCLLLLAACAYIGNLFAREVELRPVALEQLRAGLDGLRTRLEYRGEPLRPAFRSAAGEQGGDISAVFLRASELMEDMQAGEALRDALLESKRDGGAFWPLKNADIAIAYELAGRIGGDSGSQQAAFALADGALGAAIKQARDDKASHARLYRAGGILTGALLAVLFI